MVIRLAVRGFKATRMTCIVFKGTRIEGVGTIVTRNRQDQTSFVLAYSIFLQEISSYLVQPPKKSYSCSGLGSSDPVVLHLYIRALKFAFVG